MWLDGKSVLNTGGLQLWTRETYPKVGIHRGEKGDHDDGSTNVFDSWVYRVQISDASLDEVSAASGLKSNGTRSGY